MKMTSDTPQIATPFDDGSPEAPPVDPYLAALQAVEDKSIALRDAILALTPASESLATSEAWIATMTSADVCDAMGAVMLLATKNTSWIMGLVDQVARVIAAKSPESIPDVETAISAGQVRAEMACPCGTCPPCLLRASKGDAAAKQELSSHFAPKRQRRILGPNGRMIQ